jgi:hypothetical protein
MKVYNYMNNRNIPEVQYHFNKSKDTIIKCFCNECNATTNHLVVTDYYEVGEMTDEYDWTTDYQTLRCLGCDSVSFRVHKFKGLLSSGSTVFTCRPVADNKQYVASLHAGHKKGVISVRDRTQFPTSKITCL